MEVSTSRLRLVQPAPELGASSSFGGAPQHLARDRLPPQHQHQHQPLLVQLRLQLQLQLQLRAPRDVNRRAKAPLHLYGNNGCRAWRAQSARLVSHGGHARVVGEGLARVCWSYLRHEVHYPPTAPAGDQTKAKSARGTRGSEGMHSRN